MVELRATLAGIPLRHPVLLASGPLSHDGEAIVRAHRAGAAAVVTKTISLTPAKNPVPHLSVAEHGVLNCELWSDIDSAQWIQQEIPRAKEAGAVVVASIGPSGDDVRKLARAVARAGADALEMVSYEPAELPRMTAAARQRVSVPVLAKVGAMWPRLDELARECRRRGADAITAVDSLGPAVRIDVQSRRPVLGGASCWMSGAALLPIALKAVATVRQATGGPVVGTGGISSGRDALEMVMAGASLIGVCSVALSRGLCVFRKLVDELGAELRSVGEVSLERTVGAALPLATGREEGNCARFEWAADRCTGCGRCVDLCPYAARSSPSSRIVDRCRLCGLCVSVCPTGALSLQGATK